MIERQIVAQKLKEKEIETFIFGYLGRISCSHIMMQRTPLGEKISVYTSRPGMIVGKRGANIKKLTDILKTKFNMENPQLEVVEIENPYVDAASVARSLMSGFERFGPKRFKAMAYRALEDALKAGARGIEVVIGGRGVPSERAKTWRFSAGYLKKSGDISANYVDRSYEYCKLRSGTIGVKVSILHPEIILPDDVKYKTEEKKPEQVVKKDEEKIEIKEEVITEKKTEDKKNHASEKKSEKKSEHKEKAKEVEDVSAKEK